MSTTCTPLQAAAMFGCALTTIYRRAHAGHLTAVQGGDRLTFDADDMAGMLARHRDAMMFSTDSATAARRLGITMGELYSLIYRGKLERWPSLWREIRVSNASLAQYESTKDIGASP